MSFDLAVWHSDTALSVEDAGTFYQHIGREWVIVREHPALRDFCEALMAEFPGVIDPADLKRDFTAANNSMLLSYADLMKSMKSAPIPRQERPEPAPWNILPNFYGCAMTLQLWARSEEIGSAILRLAGAHGLTVYNPQADEVMLPPHLIGQPCIPLPEPVRLLIEEQPDRLTAHISLEGRTLLETEVASRADAHRLAREHTIALNRLAYETTDERPISREMKMQAAAPNPGADYIFNLLQGFAKKPRDPKS